MIDGSLGITNVISYDSHASGQNNTSKIKGDLDAIKKNVTREGVTARVGLQLSSNLCNLSLKSTRNGLKAEGHMGESKK